MKLDGRYLVGTWSKKPTEETDIARWVSVSNFSVTIGIICFPSFQDRWEDPKSRRMMHEALQLRLSLVRKIRDTIVKKCQVKNSI